MRAGGRAIAAAIAAAAEQATERALTVLPAVVESVETGAASDGNDLVMVRWRGALIAVHYPVDLQLAPNQTVVLAIPEGGSPPFVLTRLVGTP